MGAEIVCLVVLFLGMVTTASTATVCSNPKNFGDKCAYQCHCASNAPCNPVNGSCSNGCASGWEGEYCQRGNVAAGMSSSTTQSSIDGSYSSSLALDGNANQAFSSCSHTKNENQPWWQVDLGKEYVLFTVKIWNSNGGDVRECKNTQNGTEYRGTLSRTRNGFTCADWLDETVHEHNYKPADSSNYCRHPSPPDGVEPWCYTTDTAKRWDYCNVPLCQAKLKNFTIWMDSNLCHHYTGTVGFTKATNISCDTPVVGRNLKIQLMDSSTVLTLCEVSVQAFQPRVPGPPRTLMAVKQSTTTLLLNWIPPKYNNGLLMPFMATCAPIFSFDPIINSERHRHVVRADPDPDVKHLTVTGLTPATEYNCSIAAQTSRGYGPSVWLRAWTEPEKAMLPQNLFCEVSLAETTHTTITVVMKKLPKSLKYGSIGKVRVGVEKLANARRRRSAPLTAEEHSQLTDYKTAKANGYTSYIAAELDANYSGPFVIGDGETYGGYYNPPLETGEKYDVLFGMVFTAGKIETTSYRRYGKAISVRRRSSVGVAVGLSVGFLVLLVAIIVPFAVGLVVIRRRTRTKEPTGSQHHLHEEPTRMQLRRRDLPDALGVGETKLAAIDQQNDSVYEIISTNEGRMYQLADFGMSSSANTSTECRPSAATDEPTCMYANTEPDSRVGVANIYEVAVRAKHEQTTYETFEKDRMNEAETSPVDGGYEDPRCGRSDAHEQGTNTTAVADLADASASHAYEFDADVQESENTYQNMGEAMAMTPVGSAIDRQDDSLYEIISTNEEKKYELADVGMSSGADTSTECRPKYATEETTCIYANAEPDSRVAVANIYEVAVRAKHEETTYETFEKDRISEAETSPVDGGYEDPRCGRGDASKEGINTTAEADFGDASASYAYEFDGEGQESENIYQNASETMAVTLMGGTYENLAFSP